MEDSTQESAIRGRRLRRVLLAVAASVTAMVIAGALGLWLLGRTPPPPPDSPGMYRPSSLPGLAHEHIPGAVGLIAGATVHINQRGFRGPEIGEPKPAGMKRVAVLGDSVVFGQGVAEDETLAAQLQELLNRDAGPETHFEVINAGVRGYNGAAYPVVLERQVLPLEPDLVVLVITEINDPERTPFAPKSEKIDAWSRAWWSGLPLAKQLLLGAYAREVNRLFVDHVKQLYDPDSPDWPAFVEDLTRVRDLCRERGLPLMAVTFPILTDDDLFAAQRRRLMQTLDRLGIPYLDPRPALSRIPAADLVVSPRDFHPNARALAVVAGLLAGPVADRLCSP